MRLVPFLVASAVIFCENISAKDSSDGQRICDYDNDL